MSDERTYRRLLWAYPAAYRREHGTEIVTTLLDMAEAGYGRPGRGQRLHLVACGLRQRFRIPFRRPFAVVAAVLAAVTLGALGATSGTWAGWQTAASVPSGPAMRQFVAETARYDPATVRAEPWATAMSGPVMAAVVNGRAPYSPARVRAALLADGWRITHFHEEPSGIVVDTGTDPWTDAPGTILRWRATKGGLAMSGDSLTITGGAEYGVQGTSSQRVDVWAVDNGLVRPLAVAGLVTGLVAGWLLVAGLAGRERGGPRRRTATAGLATVGFTAAVVPVVDLGQFLYRVMTYGSGFDNPHIVYGPGEPMPEWAVLAGTVIAMLAFAVLGVVGPATRRRHSTSAHWRSASVSRTIT